MEPQTLADFLLARIAEDEAEAAISALGAPVPVDCWGPERIDAECEAKRRIVELHPEMLEWCQGCAHEAYPCRADHPDYRKEWRA